MADISNSPNPPAPFPEREGGDTSSVLPSPFRGGAGGWVFYERDEL